MTDAGEKIVALYAVFGSDEEARRIGRAMVERRLAACVNILGPCRSFYRWQGELEESEEVAAIFKTRADGAEALIEAIRAGHGYEVPAIVVLPVFAGHRAYLDWVVESSGEG